MLEQPEPQYGGAQYPQVNTSRQEDQENLREVNRICAAFWARHESNQDRVGPSVGPLAVNNGLAALELTQGLLPTLDSDLGVFV